MWTEDFYHKAAEASLRRFYLILMQWCGQDSDKGAKEAFEAKALADSPFGDAVGVAAIERLPVPLPPLLPPPEPQRGEKEEEKEHDGGGGGHDNAMPLFLLVCPTATNVARTSTIKMNEDNHRHRRQHHRVRRHPRPCGCCCS